MRTLMQLVSRWPPPSLPRLVFPTGRAKPVARCGRKKDALAADWPQRAERLLVPCPTAACWFFPHCNRQALAPLLPGPTPHRHANQHAPPLSLVRVNPPPHSASRINFLATNVRTRFGSYEPESHWKAFSYIHKCRPLLPALPSPLSLFPPITHVRFPVSPPKLVLKNSCGGAL